MAMNSQVHKSIEVAKIVGQEMIDFYVENGFLMVPDVEAPGTNVNQKAGLNREILRSHWNNLHQTLSCKCGAVKEVHPAYTRQTCHKCGYVHKDNRKT